MFLEKVFFFLSFGLMLFEKLFKESMGIWFFFRWIELSRFLGGSDSQSVGWSDDSFEGEEGVVEIKERSDEESSHLGFEI